VQALLPQVTQDLIWPELFQAASTIAYQAPASQVWAQPAAVPAPTSAASTMPSSFFHHPAHTDCCTFCAQCSHMVHSCPTAKEYMHTGCMLIKNDHLHLPTGESILNDSSGHGLKSTINSWLVANSTTCPGEPLAAPPSQAVPVLQLDAHPHLMLSFEVVWPAVPCAYVMSVADPEDDSDTVALLVSFTTCTRSLLLKGRNGSPNHQDPLKLHLHQHHLPPLPLCL
jgi:hypothetical protein